MAKAHIFPRALVHDMKDGDTTVHAIERDRPGIYQYQSGPWDREILCQSCEARLSPCDDYAVKWVRRFQRDAISIADGRAFEVSNVKPKLLVQFASSILWRAAVTSRHSRPELDLGPWEPRLRAAIFAHASYQPRLFIARKRYVAAGKYNGPIVIHPYSAAAWGKRAYLFELGDLLWGLKLDSRSGGGRLFQPPFAANDANPVIVLNMGDVELGEQQDLLEIFATADQLQGR